MVSGVIISFASHVLFMLLLLFIFPPFSHFISLTPILSLLMGIVLRWFKMNCERDPCVSRRGATRRVFELVYLPAQAETTLHGQTRFHSYTVLTLIKI